MSFIPTHCESCDSSALVPASDVEGGFAPCAECHGLARTLPGQAYAEEDAALFADLDRALRDARLSPIQAGEMARELEARDPRVPGEGLQRIAKLLPTSGLKDLLHANEPVLWRKAEGMLTALLHGIELTRSQSGFVATGVVGPAKSSSGDGR